MGIYCVDVWIKFNGKIPNSNVSAIDRINAAYIGVWDLNEI